MGKVARHMADKAKDAYGKDMPPVIDRVIFDIILQI